MLRPLPMKHVRLLVMTDDLPEASLTLAETECFHPDDRPPEETGMSEAPGRSFRELYQTASTRLQKIAKLVPGPESADGADIRVVHHDELAAVSAGLRERWNEASQFEERFRHIDEEHRLVKDQEAALENFANLKIDLGALRKKTRFLDFYVGTVPRENVQQLDGAVRLAGHMLFNYLRRGDHAHVIIVGPAGEQEAQLGAVLSSAGFQALPIPQGFEDASPEEKREEFARRREALDSERESLQRELDAWAQTHHDELAEARETLRLAEPFVTLDPSIRSSGHLAVLAGWVPARAVGDVESRLRQRLAQPFAFDSRAPRSDELGLVPTVTRRSRLLAPFAMLVNQYGIPAYGEVDPTPLFAVTFLLMFGSMFGDVGQGAVIAGAAWLLRHKLGRFWPFGLMAGLSSVVFGFLYGSIFGYEHVLPALWMSPLSDPLLMLTIALGWGVVFLTVACLLAIYNRVAVGNWWGALVGHHGVVNLVFYLALVSGSLQLAGGRGFGTLPTLLVVASLAVLAWASWRHQDAPAGEKALVVFIETLETVIGYVSNTLSFLRVAAFSLNHVALSIAVFTLAGMMGAFGHVVTVILGNIFVLVLEGGIVMIQVMRLQYYEGFSRYFSGDGHAFKPIALRRASS